VLSGIIPAVSLQDYSYAYTASNIFLLIYCAVIILRATSHVRQWLGFRDTCEAYRVKPSATVRAFTETTAESFGITSKVQIWYHTNISGPLTYGLLKPVILLPVALVNNLSTKEVESLIIHELTHIRYNDYAFNFLVIFMETIFFFNPFIRSIVNDIRLEREKNCDQHVINFRYDPVEYAETLLKTLRLKPVIAGVHIGAVNRKYHLMKRIKFFTSETGEAGCRKILALSYMAIILFFCVNLFTLSGLKSSRIFEATALTSGFTPRIMISDHAG
jgi:beta-lactamase regulating signal transducer with metallopeptidase domain